MKVGIMTMHRIKNYGSFLQAYGLKKTIENLGHHVEFVDYKIEDPVIPSEQKNIIYEFMRDTYHFGKRVISKEITFESLFDKEYFPLLGLSKQRKYRSLVDTLIIGSDEVFNCLQLKPVGYSRQLFGKDHNAGKVASYAASFGHTSFESLKKYGIDSEIKVLFSKFSSISVRDNNSSEIIHQLTGKAPLVHVDPVIISDFDSLIPSQDEIRDYILVYAYPGRIHDPLEVETIVSFARKHNKKLVSVGSHQEWTDLKLQADPFKLLAYVKHADYVITDTFHGSIFALKYNRPFATIIRESNRQKLSDLLQRFAVSDREVREVSEMEEILVRPIDFDAVNRIISQETDKSIQYLQKTIGNH